jgi:HemY protein
MPPARPTSTWDDAATHSLEQAINADWNPQLVALYGHLPVNKFDSRRASAQAWLQAKPDDPALLLSLGRLALPSTQRPQAREFLLHAVDAGAGAEAWEALSGGFSAQGDDRAAAIAARNALKARRAKRWTRCRMPHPATAPSPRRKNATSTACRDCATGIEPPHSSLGLWSACR